MKTTNDYITILRKYLSTKADAYGITKIGIFGSVARNEQLQLLKESSTTPKQLMILNTMYFLLLAWNVSKVPVCCSLQ